MRKAGESCVSENNYATSKDIGSSFLFLSYSSHLSPSFSAQTELEAVHFCHFWLDMSLSGHAINDPDPYHTIESWVDHLGT